jgi:hypothetical protein
MSKVFGFRELVMGSRSNQKLITAIFLLVMLILGAIKIHAQSEVVDRSKAIKNSGIETPWIHTKKELPNSFAEFADVRISDMIIGFNNDLILVGTENRQKGVFIALDADGNITARQPLDLTGYKATDYLDIRKGISEHYILSGYAVDSVGHKFGSYGIFEADGYSLGQVSVSDIPWSTYKSTVQLSASKYCSVLNHLVPGQLASTGYVVVWPQGAFSKSYGAEVVKALRDKDSNCTGIGWKKNREGKEVIVLMRIAADGNLLVADYQLQLDGTSNKVRDMLELPSGNYLLLIERDQQIKIIEMDPEGALVRESPEMMPGSPIEMVLTRDGGALIAADTPKGGVLIKINGEAIPIWIKEFKSIQAMKGALQDQQGTIYTAGMHLRKGQDIAVVYRMDGTGNLLP